MNQREYYNATNDTNKKSRYIVIALIMANLAMLLQQNRVCHADQLVNQEKIKRKELAIRDIQKNGQEYQAYIQQHYIATYNEVMQSIEQLNKRFDSPSLYAEPEYLDIYIRTQKLYAACDQMCQADRYYTQGQCTPGGGLLKNAYEKMQYKAQKYFDKKNALLKKHDRKLHSSQVNSAQQLVLRDISDAAKTQAIQELKQQILTHYPERGKGQVAYIINTIASYQRMEDADDMSGGVVADALDLAMNQNLLQHSHIQRELMYY